jgi:tetratricopeptide (TPR) repeat protein
MRIDLGYRFHRRRLSPVVVLHVALTAVVFGATILPADLAQAATKHADKREIEARQAFAAGQYQQALDLYAELYAEKVHPTYLRNIGRCYQNLRQPEKAINAFRDYLRQAKELDTAEHSEVEGYIAEMEALQKQQSAQAAAASTTAAPPSSLPLATSVPPERATGAGLQISEPLPPPPPEVPAPFYEKAWFWSVVGVAVVGGVVGGLYAGGVFSKSSVPCTAADGCH